MTSPFTEKRAHPRVPLATHIQGEVEGRAFLALTADLSASGIFLYTANPFTENQTVTVSFVLPDAPQPIRTRAIVRRVAEGKGMGLEFVSLPPKDQAAIRAFVLANS